MDHRDEAKAFLSSRRAKITPEQAGLTSYNRNRRGARAAPQRGRRPRRRQRRVQALYAPMFDDPARPANHARFAFLNLRARDFWRDWDRIASDTVAMMRTEAGRDPDDRALTDLIGELSTRSEDFRTRWAAHDVRLHRTGIKQFHHPAVGDLNLNFETMPLPADPGLVMTLLSAPAGSSDDDTLRLLASWAATRPTAAPAAPPRQ